MATTSSISFANSQVSSTSPVIALTGYAMEGDRKRALESGFDKHLSKPVEPEQLVTAIQQVLSKLKT